MMYLLSDPAILNDCKTRISMTIFLLVYDMIVFWNNVDWVREFPRVIVRIRSEIINLSFLKDIRGLNLLEMLFTRVISVWVFFNHSFKSVVVDVQIWVSALLFQLLKHIIVLDTLGGALSDCLRFSMCASCTAMTWIVETELLICRAIRVVDVVKKALATMFLYYFLHVSFDLIKQDVVCFYVFDKILYFFLILIKLFLKQMDLGGCIFLYQLLQLGYCLWFCVIFCIRVHLCSSPLFLRCTVCEGHLYQIRDKFQTKRSFQFGLHLELFKCLYLFCKYFSLIVQEFSTLLTHAEDTVIDQSFLKPGAKGSLSLSEFEVFNCGVFRVNWSHFDQLFLLVCIC